jgi:hypothetical protein
VWISPSDAGLAVSVPLAQAELTEKVAKMYSAEANTVFLYGFRTAFGGGKSTGFGLVYDSPEAAKKLVPKYLQIRVRTATCCAVAETRFLRTTACAGQSAQPASEPRPPPLRVRPTGWHRRPRDQVPQADQGAQEPRDEGSRRQEGAHPTLGLQLLQRCCCCSPSLSDSRSRVMSLLCRPTDKDDRQEEGEFVEVVPLSIDSS